MECLNITDKICISMLNQFLSDHCITNNYTTIEQSGGTKGSWDKMIPDQVPKFDGNDYSVTASLLQT